MYSVSRIYLRLRDLGFKLYEDSETEAWFVRANREFSVFEQLNLNAGRPRGGNWGDTSHAFVLVGVKPGRFSPDGLTEAVCIADWADTASDNEAEAWERRVVDEVETRLPELTKAHCTDLLPRTAACRSAVSHYFEFVDTSKPLQLSIETLTASASADQESRFKRIASTPGLICLPDRTPYDLAIWLIVRHSDALGDAIEWNVENLAFADSELNWRIQLLASRLFAEPGWDLMDKMKQDEPDDARESQR